MTQDHNTKTSNLERSLMPAIVSVGHRSNFGTLCAAIAAGHTELRVCKNAVGVDRIMICLVSTKSGMAEVMPFAELIENPLDYVIQSGLGQAISQTEAMEHALVNTGSSSLES